MINVTDPHSKRVMQGKRHVSSAPNEMLTSILGPCVAACVRDPILQVGGMNHFLLPVQDPRGRDNIRYGARSTGELINAVLRAGAMRTRLKVWLFGGANVLGTNTGTGAANCAFALEFVHTEGFVLRGSDLGGTRGRRVKFHPFTGKIDMTLLQNAPVEKPIARKPIGQENRILLTFFALLAGGQTRMCNARDTKCFAATAPDHGTR